MDPISYSDIWTQILGTEIDSLLILRLTQKSITKGIFNLAHLFIYSGSHSHTLRIINGSTWNLVLGTMKHTVITFVWSEAYRATQCVAQDPSFLHAESEDSDQTGWMPRLIWIFAGRTCHFIGFVMRRLILHYLFLINSGRRQLPL